MFVDAENPENDVFLGVTHLQVHRRARTLARIASTVSAGSLSLRTLRDVVFVLVLQLMQDAVKDPSEKNRWRAAGSSSSQSNVAGLHTAAVSVLGAIAALLPWGQYLSALRGLLVEVCCPTLASAAAHCTLLCQYVTSPLSFSRSCPCVFACC